MHDCRVLTHHSAATAQPRAEAGRCPGASVQKPCPAQVARAGGRQLKACSSVLAHSPGSSLGRFLLLLINMCCDLPVAAEILNTSLHSPDPFQSLSSPAGFHLHFCMGHRALLTSFPSHSHLGPSKCFLPPLAVIEKLSNSV